MRWWVLGLLLSSGCSWAVNTECLSERTQALEVVCQTQSLSTMNHIIGILYKKDLKLAGSESLKAEQEAWLELRDQRCLDKESCEDSMIERINQLLIHLTERRVKNLQKGMDLPDGSGLDNYSKDALKLVGQEHYHPWKRRAVLKPTVKAFEPVAAVFGNEVFVFYKTYTSNYRQIIHELNLMTMQGYQIASGDEYSMTVKGNQLLFVHTSDKEKVQLYSYTIGSKMYPTKKGQITSVDFQKMMGRSDRTKRWALSHDGRKIAVITSEINHMSTDSSLSENVSGYIKAITEKLDIKAIKDDRTIAVYDSTSDQVTLMPGILDGAKERIWWRIFDMVWTDDDTQIYFDNEGQRFACIWQYDLVSNQVTKIVPEHTAITPYPFKYKGQPYIVYIQASGGYDGKLILATPSE
ncbi:DUF1311 domain-containing protein [Vibrio salinus]|uniref:DUF1311 domain-containing protein n=1 Tax=Vibrio salinus TaxID=2899784 RepID=UPI001E3AE97F|nr:DUF1311 domain-containing protein [Vibrio salinus]MCE0494797.1 DUF1311 domain-containing protein [Vibrio salinus]